MAIRTPDYDSATVRRIAVEATADPRTVVRRLTGQPVAGVCAQRIDAAVARLGLAISRKKAGETAA